MNFLLEYTEVPPEEELHPSQMKTVGEILDLIERIQQETDSSDTSSRAKNVGIEFIKIAMGEIPVVGGALGAADGLFAMYQAGKNEEHTWAELEEYPILARMKMHPDIAKHLDPITLREVDKAYQEYLRTLGRKTLVSDIRDIDVFTSDWVKDDTEGNLNVELLREYVRELLKEDPMGFVRDLAGSEEFGEDFYGGGIDKAAGREIKRVFNANADHQWLSTLDTVHWASDAYDISELLGQGKDELSTTMSLSSEPFTAAWTATDGGQLGLWIKGRITLAANDHDSLYTGKWHDYMGGTGKEGKEQEHRAKSSGVNKRPTISKDYSGYGQLKPGNEFGEKMARNIPYVLDQSTWDPSKNRSGVNEALVDNWRAVGVVVADKGFVKFVKHYADKDPSQAIGAMKELFKVATDFGVPIYDANRTELWSPE